MQTNAFTLGQPIPGLNLWQAIFKNPKTLGNTFCRVQEYYESPFPEIRRQNFTMKDFRRIYSERKGEGIFSYCDDWSGFNVPGHIIIECYSGVDKVDINQYDRRMIRILNHIQKRAHGLFYLIGSENNEHTIEHETHHALFYLDEQYRKQVLQVLKEIPRKYRVIFSKQLLTYGYCKETLNDEIHAYLSTEIDFFELRRSEKDLIRPLAAKLQELYSGTLAGYLQRSIE